MDWGQHRAGQLSKLMEPSDTGIFKITSSTRSQPSRTASSTTRCERDTQHLRQHAARNEMRLRRHGAETPESEQPAPESEHLQ